VEYKCFEVYLVADLARSFLWIQETGPLERT
jgi:hypothetical protein